MTSLAIFGALFQSVMDPAERRARGAHYTTEQNIPKVIEPLFLDDLSVIPETVFLVIPEVGPERHHYVLIGWLQPPFVPNNQLLVIQHATLWQFALLTSAMHMAWLRYVDGRLESRYRYSSGLVYNTFPPPPQGADLAKLEPLAQAVLDARAGYPSASLADLNEFLMVVTTFFSL